MVDLVITFYSLLTVAAILGIAALVVLRIAASGSESASRGYDGIAAVIERDAIGLAFVVAALATAGSLFFSEVAHFEPCRLCWYQRIAMYPLVVLLGLGLLRRDPGIGPYARVLAAIGAVISAYHVALEWIPALDTGACGVGPACTLVWFRGFGLISLPTMALAAFLLIVAILSVRGPVAATADGTGPVSR